MLYKTNDFDNFPSLSMYILKCFF